jgi:HupE / UreJ protein
MSRRPARLSVPLRVTAATAAAIVLTLFSAVAHDIPTDVTVQAFVRPEGRELQLLVRVPLKAMRDLDIPTRGEQRYLDLRRIENTLRNAATLWIADYIELYEENTRLAYPSVVSVRASLPSDGSFTSFDRALAHVTGPSLPEHTDLYWEQGLLDVLLAYPIQSDRSRFSIRPGLNRLGLRVTTALRFLPRDTPERAFELHDDPGLVMLDPRWHQVALRFIRLGFFHILDGTDHLLFLACLIIPFRRFRPLVAVVTSFTVAHSITLIASAYDMVPRALWFPALVETLIAMSIVYMGLENIVTAKLRRRWLITFGFGLVHGFGFSFALRDTLQFAGSHLLVSLLSFNIGIELGQVLVLVLLIPALGLLFRFVVAERLGVVILSALVTHTGWHWLVERWERLRQFRFVWPTFDALLLASAMRWLLVIVIAAALVWLIFTALQRHGEGGAKDEAVGAGK